jgi:hypothetical protein
MKKLSITREEFVSLWPQGLSVAEVGVFKGVYSKVLESSNPARLTLIDVWRHIESNTVYGKHDACNLTDRGHIRIWKKVLEMFKDNKKVEVVRGFSTEHAKTVKDKEYDVVYIDGDHSFEGCLSDLEAWKNKISDTGFMYGHDYTDCFKWIQVIEAVDAFLGKPENKDWSLIAITSEKPRKSPSWILARKGSTVFDILKDHL